MKVIIINGPNLNLLGKREPEIYGDQSFDDYFEELKQFFTNIELDYFQSNVEGEIINKIHEVTTNVDYIIINGGGYSHTSVAIADALKGMQARFIEVHISNVYARETFRHQLLFAPHAIGVITGLGSIGYKLALEYLLSVKK